jgi:hypothetical protein
MYTYALLIILFSLTYSSIAYTCPDISRFSIECSNLSTLNQSISFCSQYGMNLLNLTDPTIALLFNQNLQSTNCTNNFWYTYGNQLGLVGNTQSLTGGVICSIVPLLGLYCISTNVVQAATICTQTNQIEIQQKCSNNELNPRFDIQKHTFIRKNIYTRILNTFQTHTISQCYGICSRIDKCIGTNYQQNNCTLYM